MPRPVAAQRRASHLTLLCSLTAVTLLVEAGKGLASPPGAVRVVVTGRSTAPKARCPSPAAFVQALHEVLPDVAVRDDAERSVRLEDRGPRYRVEAAGRTRDFLDPARRCDERARAAAVFAGMALEAPTAAPVAEAPTAPPPAAPATSRPDLPSSAPLPAPNAQPSPTVPRVELPAVAAASPPTSASSPMSASSTSSTSFPPSGATSLRAPRARFRVDNLHVELAASGLFAVAPDAADRLYTGGALGRLVVRYGALGLTVGGGWLGPHFYPVVDGYGASVQRFPLDLGARFHVELGRFQLALQAALVVVPVVVEASPSLVDARRSTQVELGGSLGVELRVAATRWLIPFVAVSTTWLGRRALLLVGTGSRSDAYYPWLATSVGVAWNIR